MENLTSPKVIKDIIEKYKFNFSKSLGQNFLIDQNVVRKIIEFADVSDGDYVLEIGPGIGTMTKELCKSAKKVVAVEIDNKLIPILTENLKDYSNYKLINDDILKVDIKELSEKEFDGNKFKVIANLPYYITTPIIMELLEKKPDIISITVMIQKEVAQRMQSKPGTKDYGALSVAVQYYSNPKPGFVVSKSCFMPSPKVDSMVISLEILSKPKVQVKDQEMFFKLIRASFMQRRKTLINAVGNSQIIDKEKLREILKELSINEQIRGESLSIQDFANIINLNQD